MSLGSGGAMKVLCPLVVRTADVRPGKVSGVRGVMYVVAQELAVESVGSDGSVLEAQGLEVQFDLLLQNADLGRELIVFF